MPRITETGRLARIRELASGRLPALYHCSAGKDRTGFATAVLHRILGVSSEDLMKDYLLSNAQYGSFDAYLSGGLKLSAADLSALRHALLESAP